MNLEETWRTFLSAYYRQKTPLEKKTFVDSLGVSVKAMNQWRRNETTPRGTHLIQLIRTIDPAKREHFLTLLKKDPNVWDSIYPVVELSVSPRQQSPTPTPFSLVREQQSLLPQEFYAHILSLQRLAPAWVVYSAILNDALLRLETHPVQTGLTSVIIVCMPPRNGVVRSLREYLGMGTAPWRQDLHRRQYFLGKQSLAGQAIVSGHEEVLPDLFFDEADAETEAEQPVKKQVRSSVAYPISYDGRIAGLLLMSSAQRHYFTSERIALLGFYADLLRVAFFADDEVTFYASSVIDLAPMPTYAEQRPYLLSFQSRVEEEIRRLNQAEQKRQDPEAVTRQVRVHLEGELLQAGTQTRSNALASS